MAVTLEQTNLSSFLQDFQSRLSRRTNVNLFDRDSKTQALVDVFSEQLVTDRREVIGAIDSLQISKAKGEALIKRAADLGVPVYRETFATVNKNEVCLAFFVDSGTFGDLNSGSGFTIPKGKKVWSDAKQNDLGASIYYTLTEDVECGASETIAYASAKADASGADFNVGASTLKNHDAAFPVRVLNFFSILNGRNRESEDQLRFRIAQFYTTTATSNETKAQLLALSVPGVLDTKIIRGHYGIGSTAVVVLGAEYQANPTLVNSVQQVLNSLNLPGVSVTATAAVNALFDIEVTLYPTKILSTADKTRIKSTLRRVTINYLRSQGLGGSVSILELSKVWARSLNGLVQLKASASEVFDHIYVRRGYVTGNASERETFIGSVYTLQEDEFADLGTLTVSFG